MVDTHRQGWRKMRLVVVFVCVCPPNIIPHHILCVHHYYISTNLAIYQSGTEMLKRGTLVLASGTKY